MGDQGQCTVEKQSEVSARTNNLDRVTRMLSEAVAELENRLSRVLRNEPPKAPDDKPEQGDLVPLAQNLYGIEQGIKNTTEVINGIMDRLEL